MTATPQRPRAALAILATLAATYAIYLGHDVLVPVCLALVLIALLVPAVRWLARHHVPATVGAALTVVASLAMLVAAVSALEPPVRALATQIPRSMATARARLDRYREPLARIGIRLESSAGSAATLPLATDSTAARQPATKANGTDSASARAKLPTPDSSGSIPNAAPSGASSSPSGSSSSSRLLSAAGRTFGVTTELLSELIEVLLLALFVLGAGDAWSDKLARAVPDERSRRSMLAAAREVRGVVTRYVLVTAAINVSQGLVVALAMWALGVPSPLLWGILTFILEFVPYLGGFVMVGLLTIAGLAAGGTLLHALLAPIAYLTITSIQNNLVSPAAYGRGLRLNPAAILLSVMIWYAMWGVAGAFLAVPILAVLRVLSTHVRPLAPVGIFLEE